ncbi:MAG: hypothetical protein R3B90_13995 [Planctomycetaceae bacterium]
MTDQPTLARRLRPFVSTARWVRVVALCSLLLAAPGCAQVVLLGLLIGGPPHIQPEFETETGESLVGTDAKVAVVCYVDPDVRLKYSKIDVELSAYVAGLMKINKINIIEPDYVRAWIDTHPDWETAEEVGRAMEADYVIELELVDFGLYEPHSATLFRGNATCYVKAYQIPETGSAQQLYSRDVDFMFPTKIPRPTTDQTELSFKREYLSRLGEEIGFLFYPSYTGDKIAWAN